MVRQLTGKGSDISSKIQDLPKLTGSGPFAQEPKFEVLGHPGSMIHVVLPASGSVYTRRGSVIGVNGALNDITSTLVVADQPIRKLAKAVPILYQKVTSTSPVTLLVGTNGKHSYTIADVSPENSWIICRRKALLGWNASSLVVEPFSGSKLWGNVKASGSGQIALIGEGELYQIEVNSGEEILINPSNIVAYSTEGHGSLTRRLHSNINLELPVLVSSWLEQNKVLKTFSWWLKSVTSRLLWRDDIALRLQGPSTVIVQTQGSKLNHLFTKEQLRRIIQQ